ncbi:MAG: hypothetical protein CVU56_27335 [Deltaproteobacteria bacterium HGW-Deltaproteobacteria-14]|jgi:hypothetical protein|nr:MAG: hypothetical protein CVU56_27335 [Deltaproteobacteria bacterium HGW-Deltaproteobacteria-14]
MRRFAVLSFILLALAALASIQSCKAIQRLLPATEVTDPAEGTPEYVIQQIIIAGMAKDSDDGWKLFRPWLHSEELDSPASEKNWRQFNFEALHRNVKLYLEDPTLPIYKIDYDEETDGGRQHRWFIVNQKSDMPSPVVMKPDPKADGEWRVKRMSLGL